LTDNRFSDIETIPLKRANKNWWVKLELFSLTGPTVYFDLDTIIVSDITDICTYPHRFTGLTNFKHKGKTNAFASGFMAWNGDFSYLDRDIDAATDREYRGDLTGDWQRHGDQGWVNDHLEIKPELTGDLFPGRFVSYKWDVRRKGRVPDSASVVCFHGVPRPHEIGWSLPNAH
jgi:hypothetical protein